MNLPFYGSFNDTTFGCVQPRGPAMSPIRFRVLAVTYRVVDAVGDRVKVCGNHVHTTIDNYLQNQVSSLAKLSNQLP